MLRLILGRRQSGKTHYCINLAKAFVKTGKNVIFLVPEQYSFECQRLLLKQLGPQVSNLIAIHSFSSLCTEIGNVQGGNAGKTVDDGIRYIFIKRSLNAVRDSLKHYSRYVGSDDFAKKLLLIFSELKQASLDPQKLNGMAIAAETELLRQKLSDIAAVMGTYDELLKGKFIEPFDLIERTVDKMADNSFFENTVIFADGFKGFTDSQYRLISRMTEGCDDFYVTLCCDSDKPLPETDVFKNVSDVAVKLKKSAENSGVGVANTVMLDRRPENNGIAEFESFIAGRMTGGTLTGNESVKLRICSSVYDEADFIIKDIRSKVRKDGRRYRDFVIITRNEGAYGSALADVAEKYGVPLFRDRRTPASELPISIFAVSALKAADKLDTDDLFAFLKTGLAGLSAEETAELENYAFVWNINGRKWLDKNILNPDGYTDSDKKPDKDRMMYVAALKERAVNPLCELGKHNNASAVDIGTALMRLIDRCGTVDKLKELAERLDQDNLPAEADKQRKGYDVFIETLNKAVFSLEKETVGLSEFADILWAALSFETVGEIPQKNDEVLYGTADRIRTADRKISYIAGVNEGIFPASVSDGGLLSESERRVLIENGAGISDCGMSDCIDEHFMLYYSLISASEEINISCSESAPDGSTASPSELFKLAEKQGITAVKLNGSQLAVDDIESKEPAFKKYALNFRSSGSTVRALESIFESDPLYRDRCAMLEAYKCGEKHNLSNDAVQNLYGSIHKLSPSEIEVFSNCRFKHFCQYGLRVKKLERAEFDAKIRGKIIHFVLEEFVKAHKSCMGSVSEDDIADEVKRLCDKYIEYAVSDAAESDSDEKLFYMVERIRQACVILLTALSKEFAQSGFQPQECEYNLESKNGIELGTGNSKRTLLFNGKVDRIDTTEDGRLRVVDYKTGGKDFSLGNLLYGLDTQMLLYLYYCVNECKEIFQSDYPAGVLYFPAQKVDADENGYIRMRGIVDPDSISLMERDCAAKIVPIKLNSDGNVYANMLNNAVTKDEFRVIFSYLEKMLRRIGSELFGGVIDPIPLFAGRYTSCKYCDYSSVCRVASSVYPTVIEKRSTAETIELMKKETEEM